MDIVIYKSLGHLNTFSIESAEECIQGRAHPCLEPQSAGHFYSPAMSDWSLIKALDSYQIKNCCLYLKAKVTKKVCGFDNK